MGYEKYKQKKNVILQVLNEVKNNISEKQIQNILTSKINNFEKERFTIAIFGHFSNGKSTFLNALMGYGDEIFPRW
ncbi:dynamin family protein [Clostridium tarantellae]|uniref:Dynamin N-terminal domain-containing protein n=1 Tax=Clostridium tarantellae TaxID=39493 RepID=A0A6I1MHZ4_9CLOT|nr:dynamin family protein [Clostridium tarantellae]MPQ42504.1 hypothetical protein [Clostridium tarantellae]